MTRPPAQANDIVSVPAVRGGVVPVVPADPIQSLILTVRGVQVLLDRDLAALYGVPTKSLNQAVKRNPARFPAGFRFSLSASEMEELVTNCDRFAALKHSSVGAQAFTEQGIAMLSAVLKSKTAVAVSVQIMRAFVAMRRFLAANADVFRRLDSVERRQIATDEKVDAILDRLDGGATPPQGVFFDGQLWDARSLAERLVSRAKTSILLVDNWIGPSTLDILAKKGKGVAVQVVTSQRGNKLAATDLAAFNAQYPSVSVQVSASFHDRFLVLDDKELYLVGASLKDLGRKCFAFAKMDPAAIPGIKARI